MAKRIEPLFEVDKEGLAKQLARKGVGWALLELVQNALDEDVRTVEIELTPIEGKRGRHRVRVEDDSPDGFKDLKHAYTLFADSYKKDNPEQRGRFNIGEKLVVAICDNARIETTTGTVLFEGTGRQMLPEKRAAGTVFTADIRMTKDEARKAERAVQTVLVPDGVEVTFNGRPLPRRKAIKVIDCDRSLVTEIADDEGLLKRVARKTTLALYEPLPDEKAMLYEMGIPVVETGDTWHVDVHQKVPLNTDRDNVPPAYLRELRREVLNNAAELLSKDDAGEKWVDNAMEDEYVSATALNTALDKRFGEKRVGRDMSDPEANKLAVADGYVIVEGRSLSKKAWENVRRHEAAKPAGQVTPSPKVLISMEEGSDNGVREEDWTPGMRNIANYAKALARKLMDVDIEVRFHNDAMYRFAAWYGRRGPNGGGLTFNVGCLGYAFFDQGPTVPVNDILLHEFGHQFSSDHLETAFFKALTRLGAKLAELALTEPEFFATFETGEAVQDTTAVPA